VVFEDLGAPRRERLAERLDLVEVVVGATGNGLVDGSAASAGSSVR